eukprot:superscaffoldBa00000375_g4205
MLQWLLEQKRAIIAMGTQMDLGGSFSHHQWRIVEATVKILQPFEEATRNVCEDVTSLFSVIPCVQALKAFLGNLVANEAVQALSEVHMLAKSLETLLVEYFQPIFDDPTSLYFKATLLDPTLKMMPKSLLSKSDFNRLKANVVSEVDHKLTQLTGEPAAEPAIDLPPDAEQGDGTHSKSLFWGAMQSMSKKSETCVSTHLSSSSVVDNYLPECNTESLYSDPLITKVK